MVSLEAYSRLLEVLYSAPLEQDQWEHFLALLCEHTGATLAVFIAADTRLGLSVRSQGGGSEQTAQGIATYNQRYGHSDPFKAEILRNPRQGIFQVEDLLPNEGILRTDIYRDVLEPSGIRYSTILMLSLTLRRLEAISIWRSPDQGPMDEDRNHLLQLLFPHIQKTLEIRQVLGVAQQRIAGAEAMVDASATPTFLLTRQGRVLHHNAAAQSLLLAADALALRDGCLVPRVAAAVEPLRRLFLNATFPAANHSPFALPRTSAARPLQLLVSPLTPALRDRSGADLVLLATDPEKPVNLPDDALRALFGFSPAQVEVAIGLLMGYTLQEIATLRHVSIGTVRQQVKAILAKTGTTRQADLIRLLMSLPQAAAQ